VWIIRHQPIVLLSEQFSTNHWSVNSNFLSEQISTGHQPAEQAVYIFIFFFIIKKYTFSQPWTLGCCDIAFPSNMTRYAKSEIIKIHNDYKLRGGQGDLGCISVFTWSLFIGKQKTILLINSEMK
jgi:hypothetical protein